MAEQVNVDVVLKGVRLVNEHVFEKSTPKGSPNATAAFNARVLIKKGSDNHKKIQQAFKDAAEAAWGKKADENLAIIAEDKKLSCVQDGDSAAIKAKNPEFAGHILLSAKSNDTRPEVRGRDGKTPLAAEDGILYRGCHVNFMVSLWTQDNQHGVGMRANLLGVQFHSDGEAMSGGGRVADDSMFEDLADTGEDLV